MAVFATALTEHTGIKVPLICGAMYPCSNPELVAAASEAGGIGILQPLSLTYVHGYGFREGLRYLRRLTSRPIGMNALIEKGSKRYREHMSEWLDIALEEGVRFFVTSLGKPRWVVDRVAPYGGIVYHDVTERKWALKGLESGVHGLIGVNRRAGGHAGPRGAEELFDEVGDLGVPVVCAGGVGSPGEFVQAIKVGYAGAQLGTRFIATHECTASDAYKQAILDARAEDVVLSEKITGVPVSVLNTPHVQRMGLRAGTIAARLLRHDRTKHWMRLLYSVKSFRQLKRSLRRRDRELWQAGKSVAAISKLETAGDVVRRYAAALAREQEEEAGRPCVRSNPSLQAPRP